MMDVRERAESLRRRINAPSSSIVLLALEAGALFQDAHMDAQVRWINFEVSGYGEDTSALSVSKALGVQPDDRLAVHVAAYRSQPGRAVSGAALPDPIFRHFFVEPLQELETARDRVRAVAGELLLDFGAQPGDARYPTTVAFECDVFERVLLGFRAALHLQLGSVPA